MINISQVIDDAVQNFVGANFSDGNNPIQTSIEPDLTLEADPLEVEIIVLNLLKNAVDAVSVFPESERSVWLKAKSISHAPCQGIAIEVTDNGPSLDDETFANSARLLILLRKTVSAWGLLSCPESQKVTAERSNS